MRQNGRAGNRNHHVLLRQLRDARHGADRRPIHTQPHGPRPPVAVERLSVPHPRRPVRHPCARVRPGARHPSHVESKRPVVAPEPALRARATREGQPGRLHGHPRAWPGGHSARQPQQRRGQLGRRGLG
ncbi:hypothetical protein ACFPRL_14310 [Pseudoclavibacter helvolus]